MKKTSKTKTKQKSQISRKVRSRKPKHYSVHALVIAIALLITGESALMLNATAADWKGGLAILDVSSGVSAMASDVAFVSQPTVQTVSAVNEFYNQAAISAAQLLDASAQTENTFAFVYGVNDFYKLSSQKLAGLLDVSNYTDSWGPQVAGASISR
ncbi:MAG: hypothetical protein KW788_01685 [Candidatus Doudnabacteria bacterium]|nr:hypothetical protein [Candidatus Doudnabacteria bacterium]